MPKRPNQKAAKAKTRRRIEADFPKEIWGTSYVDEVITHNLTNKVTEPELQFAMLWAELFPDIDLWYQLPLEGYARSDWDFAHKPTKVGIEIHGGLRMAKSGHNTRNGVVADMKKQARAAEYGWTYLAIASDQVQDEATLKSLANIIYQKLMELDYQPKNISR